MAHRQRNRDERRVQLGPMASNISALAVRDAWRGKTTDQGSAKDGPSRLDGYMCDQCDRGDAEY